MEHRRDTSEVDGNSPHYLRLRADVVAATWPAGTVLNPVTLADRYGVSKTPIREALHHLEHDGLLTRGPSGFTMRIWTPEDVLGIVDARSALEAETAAAAAEYRSDLDLETLRLIQHQASIDASEAETRKLNHRWHLTLRTTARSSIFTELLERLDLQLASFDATVDFASADLSVDLTDHADITDAVAQRDSEAARALMTEHQRRNRALRITALASRAAS
ncbi:GntR family transcriptional regulator [Rhodococcus sp. BP-252]|nr:GntR family transcriptional regulator [Rhodococcus sp. BP-320]MBY6419565.1 GntR family transcriptional regulator [Rhodococcus sp. BP-321]MBY6424193.1 GntR family transcriptional regulator [Rhodococcus sp. BP-324]MBY6429528.1 GntR family transcriptional regulator [Rhodococcus sp. BP-323]MBY6434407.1 GntR family transcriptional regulator [Rhodococcus sp. BP-322]MBY6443241.1 GntR family transcriptional regulator [Rhodococcus sp. BP-319]MBY6448039.1 GntR family transcriptional regulator [Rhodo